MNKEIGWLLKDKYNGQPNKNFIKDVERLKKGEPLDYVIGFTEFLGCKIDLSKKPLIPRQETEYWVEKLIAEIRAHKSGTIRCLDLFSGSGCIGMAVLKNTQVLLCDPAKRGQGTLSVPTVDFADNDKRCINQIKINCKLNNIEIKDIHPVKSRRAGISAQPKLFNRVKIIKSNIFSNINKKYDYIFANPPYIPKTRKSKLPKMVLNFEPSSALFAGDDGLFYIRRFLKQAKKYLNENGKIFMEFDCTQKKEIEKILKTLRLRSGRFRGIEYSNYKFYKDQFNRWRWVVIQS